MIEKERERGEIEIIFLIRAEFERMGRSYTFVLLKYTCVDFSHVELFQNE